MIERVRHDMDLQHEEMNILDWGCGRGRSVLWLRQRGYNALGADIDPNVLDNGRAMMQIEGQPEWSLKQIQADGRTDFQSGYFHFIFSQNVLEHVEALDAVAREMYRITSDPGVGFHSYPAHLRPVESHLFMPFVHWLPKNRAREAAIRAFVQVGVEPHWPQLREASVRQRAAAYYRYSTDKTFYRSPRLVRRAFEAAGFKAQFRFRTHSFVTSHRVAREVRRSSLGLRMVGYVLTYFVYPEFVARKQARSPNADPDVYNQDIL